MNNSFYLTNALIVNEGQQFVGNIVIKNGIIAAIEKGEKCAHPELEEINLQGNILMPGVIDDQVHFREPGLTHKGDIFSESRAAIAGGVTSYMEMPNTFPPALTQDLLEEKYKTASEKSLANYSFYMGTSNDNLEEVLKINPRTVCGVKIFMGSSTGNMLVDNPAVLNGIFSQSKSLIAVHCEDETTIKQNMAKAKEIYGENVPMNQHGKIRSTEACYLSSSLAIELAKKYGTRLHVLHLTTAKEMDLFEEDKPLKEKKITSEVCVHHLHFTDEDYDTFGWRIKWNPSVKTKNDRDVLRKALISGKLDVVATDHAPHTIEEKDNSYFKSPSGGPLVQHSLVAMFEMVKEGVFSLELLVEKMCHAPAICFRVEKRGFIREGYYADLCVVERGNPWMVEKENLLYKAAWSPFEGKVFDTKVVKTFVNGNLVYDRGEFFEETKGMRLLFNETK